MRILFSIFVTFYCDQSKKRLLQAALKKEEAQEVAASLAAATDFSMNAAKVAVLSDLDGVFTLKENKELK